MNLKIFSHTSVYTNSFSFLEISFSVLGSDTFLVTSGGQTGIPGQKNKEYIYHSSKSRLTCLSSFLSPGLGPVSSCSHQSGALPWWWKFSLTMVTVNTKLERGLFYSGFDNSFSTLAIISFCLIIWDCLFSSTWSLAMMKDPIPAAMIRAQPMFTFVTELFPKPLYMV